MYHWLQKKMHPEALPAATAQTAPASSAPPAGGSMVKASYKNAMEDAKQFVFERTARVVGLEHTAPRYDEITKPTSAPIPAACVEMKGRCACYTQQGTPMQVQDETCRQIVAHGYFLDFEPSADRRHATSAAASGVIAPEAVKVAAAVPEQSGGGVLGDGSGYGVLGTPAAKVAK